MHRGSSRGGYGGGYMNPQQSIQRANQYQNENVITVEIYGWQRASQQDLVNFISRKTRIGLQNVIADHNSGALRGTVRNKKEADDLLRASGIQFAGDTLRIKIVDDTGIAGTNTSNTINTIEVLKTFLRNRYDINSKMLNLENMSQDQLLVSNGLFSSSATSSKFFPALMGLASKEKLAVDSVNLSNNKLNDYSKYLVELSHAFPDLKNLALANNNITKLEFFERSKNKFLKLRELVLSGNPIMNSNVHAGIIKVFPRLIVLDGQIVRDENKLNAIYSFSFPKKSMFFENPDLQKASTSFISTYLNMWDNSRLDLLQLYTSESQFSYHYDTAHIVDQTLPTHSSQGGYHSSSVHSTATWGYYMTNSRNLSRVSAPKQRMARLFKGPENISQVFRSLPKTKHSILEHPELYSVETISFPSLNGMQIVIHGEFEEVAAPEQPQQLNPPPQKGRHNRYNNNPTQNKGTLEKRSFDRSFIVVPGSNGSFIVASDMLLLKSYASNKAFLEDPIVATSTPTSTPPPPATINSGPLSGIPSTTAPSPLASVPGNPLLGAVSNFSTNSPSGTISPQQQQQQTLPPDIASKLNITQQQLVLKIMSDTRLTLEFTLMLCEQSNWNYELAGQNFASSKANLPPQAYQM
ncbi:hypothetical protein CANARDRAFT_30690 [[Candida] arabinofermentans NRRL YB-2248]|uniref:NTF2 domain-containing protein n=1 Tax=[Candida] arabinofermentans NRRL YB-2248 TaxID=983967 RepID=A0A1E4ST20_9ASCO|nr:hypothetical protein CANARDRAFT_30690 [[Candida] arabinofermentans NRRL YB-2248]